METNNIQKPISMVIEESKNAIVNVINSVQLHPMLLEMIVKELYLEIHHQATATAQREKEGYERTLTESTMANETNKHDENFDVVID